MIFLKRYSPHSRSLGFLLLFSRSFILEHFMIHFELTFVMGVVFVFRLIFFGGGRVLVPVPFCWSESVSAPLDCLCSFIKDHLTVFMGVCFWALYSIYRFPSTTLQHLFDKSQSEAWFWLWEELQAVCSLSFSSRGSRLELNSRTSDTTAAVLLKLPGEGLALFCFWISSLL